MSLDRTLIESPTVAPLVVSNETALEIAEEVHVYAAWTAVLINVTLIGCLLLAYYVKRFRIYTLPESAGALLVGIVVGGLARLCTNRLRLFEFVSDEPFRRVVCLRTCLSPDALSSRPKYSFLYFCHPLSSKPATVCNEKTFLRILEPSHYMPW